MISIPKFSSINPSKFEFNNSNKSRLALLKGYLTSYALQLVSHLILVDGNYKVAVSLLTIEFLDVPFIINEIFKQVTTTSPKYDPDFVSVKQYLGEVSADLLELKTSYNLDFF